MSIPRFHVPGAAPGARLTLPDHLAHHAREVLRLRAGSEVRVFDGEGSEFEATLDSVTRQGVTARLGGPTPARCPESPLRITLALPPLKGDRMETVIQKATELGVAEVRPVVTARTDAAGRPALQGSRQERWEKVPAARRSSAAGPCAGQSPEVQPSDALLAVAFDGPRILFLETPGRPRWGPGGRARGGPRLVGPAGGWIPPSPHTSAGWLLNPRPRSPGPAGGKRRP